MIPKQPRRVVGLKVATLRSYHNVGGLKTDAEVLGEREGRYTFRGLIAAAVMADLVRRGIKLQWAAQTVDEWRDCLELPEYWIVASQGAG